MVILSSYKYIAFTNTPISVADIHNRMPVILDWEEIDGWLTDRETADVILQRVPPILDRVAVR